MLGVTREEAVTLFDEKTQEGLLAGHKEKICLANLLTRERMTTDGMQ